MSEEKKEKRKASSIDKCAVDLLKYAEECNIPTAFSRSDNMKACPIGSEGACCKICAMGPCRLKSKDGEDALRGVCGASLATVTARNIARMVAGGTAAHSDHARDVANTLLAAAEEHTKDYQIKDVEKLLAVANKFGIDIAGKSKNEVGKEVAEFALKDFGQQKGEVSYIRTATKKRQESVARAWACPQGRGPRGLRAYAQDDDGRGHRPRGHTRFGAQDFACRRLERLDDRHGLLGYPVRDPETP